MDVYPPAVDVSRLDPVEEWEAGPLRVYLRPLESQRLEPARPYAPYGLGYAVPVQDSVTLPDGVRLDLRLIEGVLRCVGVSAGEPVPDEHDEARKRYGIVVPEPTPWLTSDYLHRMAIDRLSAQAAQLRAVRLYRRPRGEIVGVRVGAPLSLDDLRTSTWDQRADVREVHRVAKANAHESRPASSRRGRRPVSHVWIEKAARAVQAAEREGKPTIQAIAEACQCRLSTAKKYKRLAREAGLLPPR